MPYCKPVWLAIFRTGLLPLPTTSQDTSELSIRTQLLLTKDYASPVSAVPRLSDITPLKSVPTMYSRER